MYHSGHDPLRKVSRSGASVSVVRGLKQRRLHKAFLRYHHPENWPLLREALNRMGRADLIGNGKRHLVPAWQPGKGKVTAAVAKRAGSQRQHAANRVRTEDRKQHRKKSRAGTRRRT
jgi:hypothetical protein